MKKTLLFFCMLAILPGMALSSCDSLENIRKYLNDLVRQNHSETDPAVRKSQYKQFMKWSEKAIDIAKRCSGSKNNEAGSVEELKDNYVVGKLYFQCGNCAEADKTFVKCFGNANCKTEKIGNRSYFEIIENAFSKCRTPSQHEAAYATGYVIKYIGKGSTFMQNIYDKIDPASFDHSPLTMEEIETISGRIVKTTDVIDSNLVRQLSGNTSFVLAPPFLFMQEKEDFQRMLITQEKNIDQGEQWVKQPALGDFRDFMLMRYEDLAKTYFNRFNTNGKLISVYLVGGENDESGLKRFLAFCDSIHFRATRKVAYYMPYDNSIVAWPASGGGTLIHELVHALMANDNPDAPMWINEGIASLLEETDANGVPMNNYRLIFIQQTMYQKKRCMDWTDLMNYEKYGQTDNLNYNLLAAYSRYFCKFIYDTYGHETLVDIYRIIRDMNLHTEKEQAEWICKLTRTHKDSLQVKWQKYLLEQPVPLKWRGHAEGFTEEVGKGGKLVFRVSKFKSSKDDLERSRNANYPPKTSHPRGEGILREGVNEHR